MRSSKKRATDDSDGIRVSIEAPTPTYSFALLQSTITSSFPPLSTSRTEVDNIHYFDEDMDKTLVLSDQDLEYAVESQINEKLIGEVQAVKLYVESRDKPTPVPPPPPPVATTQTCQPATFESGTQSTAQTATSSTQSGGGGRSSSPPLPVQIMKEVFESLRDLVEEAVTASKRNSRTASCPPPPQPPVRNTGGVSAASACEVDTQVQELFDRFCGRSRDDAAELNTEVHTTYHPRHTCDGCSQYPITGSRNRSTVREDYDLCGTCYAIETAVPPSGGSEESKSSTEASTEASSREGWTVIEGVVIPTGGVPRGRSFNVGDHVRRREAQVRASKCTRRPVGNDYP